MVDLKKPIVRKVESRSLRHPLVVQLDPGGILRLKEKGGRQWYSISLEYLYKNLVAIEMSMKKRKA